MSIDLEAELRTALSEAIRDVHLDPRTATRVRARVTRQRHRYHRAAAAVAATVAAVAVVGGIPLFRGNDSSEQAWADAVASASATSARPGGPVATIAGVDVTHLPQGVQALPQSAYPAAGPGYGIVSQEFSPDRKPNGDGSLSITVFRGSQAELAHIRATMYMGSVTEATFTGRPALRSTSDGARHLMWQCAKGVVCAVGALGVDDEEVVAIAAGLQVNPGGRA